MFCPKCGGKIPDDSSFCSKCGKSIASDGPTSKSEGKPRRIIVWRIVAGCILLLGAAIGFPFAAYYSKMSKLTVYEHPTKFFSFVYPKSLKMETPPLPKDEKGESSKCAQPPCLITLKDPGFNDYVTDLIVLDTPENRGLAKDNFYSHETDALQDMVTGGIITIETVNGQKAYKITDNSEKTAAVLSAMSKPFGYDSVQSAYMFFTNNFEVGILIRKPPAGAPADYNGFLDLTSLKLQ